MELTPQEQESLNGLKSRIAENVFGLGELALQEEDTKALIEAISAEKKQVIGLISALQEEISKFVDELNKKSDDHYFDISKGEFIKK